MFGAVAAWALMSIASDVAPAEAPMVAPPVVDAPVVDAAAVDAPGVDAPGGDMAAVEDPLVVASVQDFSVFVEKVKPAIVHLEVQNRSGDKLGTGTGFIVDATGLLVTNEHVAKIGPNIIAVFDDKSRVAVTGAWVRDAAHDIAILQLPALASTEYPVLPLEPPSETPGLKTGTPVAVVGSPMGFSHSLSTGVVSAIRDHGIADAKDPAEQQRLLQITAALSPGSSGSPVMRLDGTVVGVATLALSGRAQSLNFAVPIDVVRHHLDAIAINSEQPASLGSNDRPTLKPLRTAPWTNLGITFAVLLALGGAIWWLRRSGRG